MRRIILVLVLVLVLVLDLRPLLSRFFGWIWLDSVEFAGVFAFPGAPGTAPASWFCCFVFIVAVHQHLRLVFVGITLVIHGHLVDTNRSGEPVCVMDCGVPQLRKVAATPLSPATTATGFSHAPVRPR